MVAAERAELIGDVLAFAENSVKQLGSTLVDVRVKSILLPDEVSDSVFNRMRQDFARQAAQLRSEGEVRTPDTDAAIRREVTVVGTVRSFRMIGAGFIVNLELAFGRLEPS